ncbi:hypothetical protein EUAN_23670 [Andreesenia angusta]|uniref:Uncharacterized protein n=1 Tax=Andreesenia angusta TaxID=39480 RepID=A0A1S1V3K5_9FIRM|nr:hypothetical protein [Andreesenia angusta]OHW61286.1 hypothetical protein EUAN_23670 [Andreesenia angusta]
MTSEKREHRVFVMSIMVGGLISLAIEHITGFDYNIFSDGLNVKAIANFGLWIGVYALVHAVFKRLFLKS